MLGAVGDGQGGRTLLWAGAAGAGKSALLAWPEAKPSRGGGERATAWPPPLKAPGPTRLVLEAVADLGRRHPALLDGLDDNYRAEIERALAGADSHWSGEGGHQRLFVAVAELLRLAAADRGAMLVLDDLHEADEASLRLTHYLARCAITERIALLIGYRPVPLTDGFEQFRAEPHHARWGRRPRSSARSQRRRPSSWPAAISRTPAPTWPASWNWRADRRSRWSSWPAGPGPP